MYNKAEMMAEEDRRKAGNVGGTMGSMWKGQMKGAAAQKVAGGAGGGAQASGALGAAAGGTLSKLSTEAAGLMKILIGLFGA